MQQRATFLRLMAASAAGASAVAAPRLRGSAQGASTIRLGATMADDDTAIFYAMRSGLYKRAGIDVELTVMSSGGATTAAIIGGALDIGKSSLTPLFAAHTKGIPVVIVAAGGIYDEKNPFAVVVQPSDTNLKTAKDLDGKTIGVAGLGDVTSLVVSMWVDQNGGDSSTLKFIEVPNSAQTAALEQHRIDAAMLLNPQLALALMSGKVKRMGLAMSAIAPQYMLGAWFSMRDWAEKHADLVRTFARVTYEAAAYTNVHHAATAAMMAEATKIPLDVISKMDRVDNYVALDPATIQPSIDFAAKYKMISHGFPAREIVFT